MRLTYIDGFRGIFLVFMMIIHVNDILHTTFGKLNHHYFGWVEDAQGFVFLSGLVVGLVYGGRYINLGFEAMQAGIWSRIKTIYSHQLGLILVFTFSALVFSSSSGYVPGILGSYDRDPVVFPLLSALMVTGSTHMGILPMYIFFMIMTPYALRLLIQRQYTIYIVIVVASWAFAQTRLPDALVLGAENFFSKDGHAVNLGIFFNILGWQALFFGGLFIGFLMASKRLDIEFLKTSEMRSVFLICLCLMFFFGIYDRIVFDAWIGDEFSDLIKSESDRGNFSTIYLVTFLVDLVVVVWMLGPGVSDRNNFIAWASRALGSVVAFRPLVFLGQHSLHVFSTHILITYVLAALFQSGPPSEPLGILIIIASLGTLYCVACLHSAYLSHKKYMRAMKSSRS